MSDFFTCLWQTASELLCWLLNEAEHRVVCLADLSFLPVCRAMRFLHEQLQLPVPWTLPLLAALAAAACGFTAAVILLVVKLQSRK